MFLKLSCLSDSARSVKSFESVCSIVRWRVFITLCRGILWNQHFFQYSFMAPTIVHEVAFNDLRWWLSKRILLIHGLEIKLLNQKKEEKIVHCNSRLIKIWLVSLKKKIRRRRTKCTWRLMADENRAYRDDFSLQSSHVSIRMIYYKSR